MTQETAMSIAPGGEMPTTLRGRRPGFSRSVPLLAEPFQTLDRQPLAWVKSQGALEVPSRQ